MALCPSKLAVIGMGNVGCALAHHLTIGNTCDELVLINRNREKAWGEAEDLKHSLGFSETRMRIYAGDYADCADADIVVLSVAAPYSEGGTRLDMLDKAALILSDIVPQVMDSGFSGIFIVITNPVDALSYLVHKLSGLPAHRVIGTGTSLDSARLRYFLAETMEVDPRSVEAVCMGEHGDSQMIPWSQVTVGAKLFSQILKDNPERLKGFDPARVQGEIRQVAYRIVKSKGATDYGIASVAARMIKAIVRDENIVMPASVMLDGEFGESDVYAGVPAVITRNGIKELVTYHLEESELAEFRKSLDVLRDVNGKMMRLLDR
ncbi:L-lactate dehydrogenase [uncultured Pseudodesulfovibrio sp.]|uniref:L-lactate dehydrogenase n=1 Tax=uncultured Pseudodesulfovibrio sp. TaxID=2035858 RepID=UPI0029C86E14|nr:L-lactate dehydrogenase [uncultured Pseudodesulfovibrio sp.]